MELCHVCNKEIEFGPCNTHVFGPDGFFYHTKCWTHRNDKKTSNKTKDTDGKPKLGLLYKAALDAMANVRERGTAKYDNDPESWRKFNEDDYYHAILRHATKLCDAHFNSHSIFTIEDEEMKENHAACIMVNCMFLLELEAERKDEKG